VHGTRSRNHLRMGDTWTEASFLVAVANVGGPIDAMTARALLSWCYGRAPVEWGKGDL
jgi:hypothetical protein